MINDYCNIILKRGIIMKVLSKLATTALAGVLALCSVTSVTASAGPSYMYQPTGNMIYSFYKAGNLPISGNNKFGNTTMYVKYKEATDDFTIVSYKKEPPRISSAG